MGAAGSAFGRWVRSRRVELMLTQEELAEHSGLSVRTVRNLEAGRGGTPRLETQRLVVAVLGTAGPPVAADFRAPAQLPAKIAGFTGRAGYLRRLDELLAEHHSVPAGSVLISAIEGAAGVGKTALAVQWAHSIADRFPDGQLYINLRGFDSSEQAVAPADAVRSFLYALGVPPERIPPSPEAQATLYRSLIADKRALVLLDNALNAEQVRPLLPGTSTVLVVVTSRNQLTALVAAHGAFPLTVDILSTMEARELLDRRLGAGRVAADPEAVEQIITACARLPLALSIGAARAQQTGFPLTTIAAELSEAGQRLDTLDAGDTTTEVRAVFSWSYNAQTAPVARLFRLLGLHAGPDISTAAAASLAGQPVPEARRLLTELARANLLVEHLPGRYTFHDLLCAYAADLTHTHDPGPTRRAAITRLLDHYTHTAHTAERLLYPARDPIPLPLGPPAPGAGPEHLADYRAAMAWLTTEHPVLLAAQRRTAGSRFDTHTWQLAWTLQTFLDRQGHWHDLTTAWRAALPAAGRLADQAALAVAHRSIARAHTLLNRPADAHAHLQHALDLHTRAGDGAGLGHAQHNLAILWERQGNLGEALDHARQALTHYQSARHLRGQADALNAVGWYLAQLGDHDQALASCRQALTLYQQFGDRHGEAFTWDSLGYAHHHLGRHTKAADCYQHATDLLRDLGDRFEEAITLTNLGDNHHAAGNPTAARTAWANALHILTDLDHPDLEDLRAKLHTLERSIGPEADRGTGPASAG